MTPEAIARFPALPATLRNGLGALLRPLAPDDGEVLAAFYAEVPREDIRFYCPHPLDREHALRSASRAHSPQEVVLVLEVPGVGIGGYAWYRWEGADAERSGFGICISRACQGVGAGKLLMTRLLEIAREIGPAVMCLTVQLANAPALALYRQTGFRVVREQTRQHDPAFGFGPEPEYYMERPVR